MGLRPEKVAGLGLESVAPFIGIRIDEDDFVGQAGLIENWRGPLHEDMSGLGFVVCGNDDGDHAVFLCPNLNAFGSPRVSREFLTGDFGWLAGADVAAAGALADFDAASEGSRPTS